MLSRISHAIKRLEKHLHINCLCQVWSKLWIQLTHNCKLIEWFNTKHCFCYYIVFAFERASFLYNYVNIIFHQEKIMNIMMFGFTCLSYQIELSNFRNKTVKNDKCSGWTIWCKYMIISWCRNCLLSELN